MIKLLCRINAFWILPAWGMTAFAFLLGGFTILAASFIRLTGPLYRWEEAAAMITVFGIKSTPAAVLIAVPCGCAFMYGGTWLFRMFARFWKYLVTAPGKGKS